MIHPSSFILHPSKVGLIGLGLVGSALAERFLGAGLAVIGYDLDSTRRDELRARGGAVADSALEVARTAPRIVLSLPDSTVVHEVIESMHAALAPGTIIIDTTTGDPEPTAALGAALAEGGIAYIDATIAGSSVQVRSGAVIVMAGGDPEAITACGDLFAAFATQAFPVGPCGSGSQMKLIVNLVMGLNRAVLAEGLGLAHACGVDPAAALEVLRAGPAYSRMMDIKGAKMIAGDFTPQARLAQHLKDVRLILKMGQGSGARLPLTALHHDLLARLATEGYHDADNSAIIRAFWPDSAQHTEETP
jgi:3-hydroxyisobutyrate dehydrogenase-like beta-hydroxyacid dehydrogenase